MTGKVNKITAYQINGILFNSINLFQKSVLCFLSGVEYNNKSAAHVGPIPPKNNSTMRGNEYTFPLNNAAGIQKIQVIKNVRKKKVKELAFSFIIKE